MPSAYLAADDLALYGVANATSQQIAQGSSLVDAYLKRPEGLVWSPDSQGLPCFMAALSPMLSLKLNSGISPGANVAVEFSGPASMLQVGDVVILDRANANSVEACVIASTSGPSGNPAITLQSVINAHDAQATADTGLVIEEQKYMPDSRPITFASRAPLMRVISGTGRYGYGRRGDAANYNMEQFNLLAAVSKFGGPPAWELMTTSLDNSWDVNTGQVWIPSGIMLAYYSEVKLRYVAGFPASSVPGAVKQACAMLIQAAVNVPNLGNVKMYKAGDTQIENWAASFLSDDIKMALQPYMARLFV